MHFLKLHPKINAAHHPHGDLHFFDNEQHYSKGLEFYNDLLPRRIPGAVSLYLRYVDVYSD